jgi:imidazolonepropionase-like amidohydrolase
VIFSQGGRHEAASVRNLPYAAAQAAAFGLPREEALKGLTLYPAEILGVADRLGSIEPGKEASLFAADGDILDIRTRVTRMWIAGKETPLESRHTRLYEKYRSRPKP